MLGNKLINTNAGGGCTNTVDLYNPFPDGGGVALYQLNGDATDVSGNYDATTVNAITWGGAGEFGTSAAFNGSTSNFSIDATATTPIDFSSENFTISMWLNPSSLGSLNTILGKYSQTSDSPTTKRSIVIRHTSSGEIQVTENNGSAIFVQLSTATISANNWSFVSYVRESGSSHIYINNNSAETQSRTNTIKDGSVQPITIGGVRPNNAEFNGSIDQVRIFSRALRPYEVEALYTEEYCTPTIVPSEHFNTVLYTGNGTAAGVANNIGGVGFQPDLVWVKNKGAVAHNGLFDVARGVGEILYSNLTNPEASAAGYHLSSFNTDGFTMEGNSNVSNLNNNSYVAWNFKAGGAAVTNTDGTITSQVSANTEAGFSIVKVNGNNGNVFTFGHGLDVAPSVVFLKGITFSDNWMVYTSTTTANAFLSLNQTAASNTNSTIFNNTEPTNEVFTVGTNSVINNGTNPIIAYCFAEVEGFSNFGSYVGTAVSGNTVVTGFEPAFLMIKRTDSGDNWLVFDNKRSPSAPVNLALIPNSSAAEEVGNLGNGFTFLENGFNVVSTDSGVNANGGSYIYMAFATDPTAVEPTLEDSFNTVLYTGNGGTQTIGGVFEGGASFNGSSYIQASAGYPSTLGDITVSGWFNFSNTNNGWVGNNSGSLFSLGQSTSVVQGNSLTIRLAENSTTFNLQSTNNDSSITMNTASPSIGTWFHIALTYEISTNKFKVYLNGAYQGESAALTYNFQTTAFRIGSGVQNGGVFHFQGLSDQVRIFNTVLTAAQVTELYEETDADSSVCNFPSGAGGIALYELNGNANDTCGTYNGTATSVTWLNNGVGFQPDLVWIKGRTFADNHNLADSVRGAAKYLFSNLTSQEFASSNYLTSFDSNGFTVGSDNSSNKLNENFVAWAWKGAEIPAINSNGSIPSVVSANPAAGFSIVSYTGNSIIGSTVGHGLDSAPDVVIYKGRESGLPQYYSAWGVYHSALGATKRLWLDDSYQATTSGGGDWINNTEPTDSVFTVGEYYTNWTGRNFIAYCFAEVAGFSNFGSYAGGSTGSGNVINTGFKPMFVMVKRTDISGDAWQMFDSVRGGGDTFDNYVQANTSAAEVSYNQREVNFTNNGFYWTFAESGTNISGGTYIYMAFANQF